MSCSGAAPEDRARIEAIFQILAQISLSEQAYAEAIMQAIEEMSSFRNKIGETISLNLQIRSRSNDIALGKCRSPLIITDEGQPLPCPPQDAPSSDPEALRLAYESLSMWTELTALTNTAALESRLNMYELLRVPTLYLPDPGQVNKAQELFRRLPGLSPQQTSTLEKLPKIFQGMQDHLRLAVEHQYQKKKVQTELDGLIDSALRQTSELRDCYLKSLASGQNLKCGLAAVSSP